MKPNEFKISTVLWIVIYLIMLIRIATSQSPCENVAINNKISQRFLRTYNNTVAADSENKYYLYSVNIEGSINFFLYDNHTDMFICVKKQKRKHKLVPKRIPTASLCLFKEEPIISSSYIRYVQPTLNYSMIFDKKGTQYLNRTRHGSKHRKFANMMDMRAFLVKKVHVQDDGKCKNVQKNFCKKMHHRKRLPHEIRTLCKKLI